MKLTFIPPLLFMIFVSMCLQTKIDIKYTLSPMPWPFVRITDSLVFYILLLFVPIFSVLLLQLITTLPHFLSAPKTVNVRVSCVCYIWGLNVLKFTKYSKACIYSEHLARSRNATLSTVLVFPGTRSPQNFIAYLYTHIYSAGFPPVYSKPSRERDTLYENMIS